MSSRFKVDFNFILKPFKNMPLDFYDIHDKDFKNIIFSFDNRDFEKMEGALSEFKNLTGLVIDQYTDTRINQEHAQLIAKLIEKYLDKTNSKNYHPDKRLIDIQEKFMNTNNDLFAIGD
jgi:hypothetical protein